MTTPDAERLPDTRPTAAPDEISLRELYLVLKRRSPWILLAAALVAVAVFLFASTRPPTYVAEGTTVVARAPIQVELGTNLRFRPEVTVAYDMYETLARSRTVLEAVLPFHEAVDVAELEPSLNLERISGAQSQPSTFLAVSHSVASRDSNQAARAAAAWIDATVATVRSLMLENLDVIELLMGDSLTMARERLETAEEAFETHLAATAPDALRRSILGADQAIVELEERIRVIDRELATWDGERSILSERSDDTLMGVVLSTAPDVVLGVDGALASLAARTAGATLERERALEQLAQLRDERRALAQRRADATVRLAALERELDEALLVVRLLTAIDPDVAFFAQVAPSGVRVLSQPIMPTRPEPSRAALIALLAAFVTVFAGAVLALLAEAVRAPSVARVNR